MITVGDIRKAIEGVPDNLPAIVFVNQFNADGGSGAPKNGRAIEIRDVVATKHQPHLEINV